MDDAACDPNRQMPLPRPRCEQQHVARYVTVAPRPRLVEQRDDIVSPPAAQGVTGWHHAREPVRTQRSRGDTDAIHPAVAMPCNSICAAAVSSSACPPDRRVTSASSAGSDAVSAAPPILSATSFTAR